MKNVAKLFMAFARLERFRSARGLSTAETKRWSELKHQLDATLDCDRRGAKPERRASASASQCCARTS